jgi:hypothetical protein
MLPSRAPAQLGNNDGDGRGDDQCLIAHMTPPMTKIAMKPQKIVSREIMRP